MAENLPKGAAPQENKMGVLPIGRLLANMAIPMMISMLVQACYNVVDSVFVAQLSEDAVSYTHLDVYKRQDGASVPVAGGHGAELRPAGGRDPVLL